MNTIILFWNPSISSFSMNDYLDGMKNFEEFQLDWSVYEHVSIFKGDRFYMVRVGEGNTGIVMSGVILGDPYIGEDWNGTDNLSEALIKDIHFDNADATLDIIVQPRDSEINLKFHFTDIVNVHWDAPMLNMYIYDSRIYTEYDYLVIEFDDIFLSVSCEELEVTTVDGE